MAETETCAHCEGSGFGYLCVQCCGKGKTPVPPIRSSGESVAIPELPEELLNWWRCAAERPQGFSGDAVWYLLTRCAAAERALRDAETRTQELAGALRRTDSMLSLLRHRGGLAFGTVGLPRESQVDEVIGIARTALARPSQSPEEGQ
jgi:hypothetical protein